MIQNFLKLSFVACVLFFISSCGEDSILSTDPSISFSGSTGSDLTLKSGETFTVSLNGTKNDSELNGLEIRENGVKVDVALIKFKGNNVGGNPILLTQADRQGFTNLEVTITSGSVVGVSNYTFVLIDAANNSASVSKKVTIDAAVPPTVTFNGTSPIFIPLGTSLHNFNFTAVKGSSEIVTLEVKENGLLLDKSKLGFDGTAFIANPTTLTAAYQNGFTNKNVSVATPTVAGDYEYTFIFGDLVGNKTEVKVFTEVGTALTINLSEFLFNANGPVGSNGALDLDTGKNVSSGSTEAEVQDLGINVSLPEATNWLKRIKAENGALLRLVDKSLLTENFTFNSITYNEEIEKKLWPNAGEIPGISEQVKEGDLFVVKKGNRYYAFEVDKINNTTNDNLDNYELSIKW